jgi:hypothetical protein
MGWVHGSLSLMQYIQLRGEESFFYWKKKTDPGINGSGARDQLMYML